MNLSDKIIENELNLTWATVQQDRVEIIYYSAKLFVIKLILKLI